VSERVSVRHGGRILLGNNHLYRLSCPYRAEAGHTEEDSSELMDYEQAMKEISINELTNGQSEPLVEAGRVWVGHVLAVSPQLSELVAL